MYLTPAQLASAADVHNELSELFGVPPELLALVFAGERNGRLRNWPLP